MSAVPAIAGGLRIARTLRHRALSADAAVIAKLRRGLRGCVHSTFARVINVETGNGELVTLASRNVDDAPDTIVIDIEGFANTGIRRDDAAVAAEGGLLVGPLEVRLEGLSIWDAALPGYPTDVSAMRANLQMLEAHLHRADSADRFPSRPNAGRSFTDHARAALRRRASQLRETLLRRDLDAARACAESMVGLGPGLTPAGDDFLVGLFAVLNVPNSPCHAMRSICAAVAASGSSATNVISHAAIRNAARGRVRESIQALLRDLVSPLPRDLSAAIGRVLAIGSTSGRDIATGLAFGLALNLHLGRESSCR